MASRAFIADIARALAFLSRLSVPARFFEGHDGRLSFTVRAFPVAGLLIAALPAALLALFGRGDALVAGILALGALTLITGGLHEDGLADAADGLGGGRDLEHALAIMKDSRTGSYGVTALILVIGLKVAALSSLVDAIGPGRAALALLGAAALSRACLVWHWRSLPPARSGGVAAAMGLPDAAAANLAYATAAVALLLLLVPAVGPLALLIALMVASLATAVFTRFVRRKLGGHTGDTLGATEQLAMAAFLAGLALAL